MSELRKDETRAAEWFRGYGPECTKDDVLSLIRESRRRGVEQARLEILNSLAGGTNEIHQDEDMLRMLASAAQSLDILMRGEDNELKGPQQLPW